jgi:hypothetical protein
MIELQALNKQANNPNAPEQSQAIGGLQRVSASGDRNRYQFQTTHERLISRKQSYPYPKL